MEVLIRPDRTAASRLVASVVARSIRDKPDLVLACATGSTMEGVYRLLVEQQEAGGLDFSHVRTFNLDEYVGLTGDDPGSYRHYMNNHLFDLVNIERGNTFLPNGTADDAVAEGELYEAPIREQGVST